MRTQSATSLANPSVCLQIITIVCNLSQVSMSQDVIPRAGIGLYPNGALINHSDAPNAVQVFKGRRIQFRAVRDTPAGDEITITYIELADTTAARRWELLRGYHFDVAQVLTFASKVIILN